MIQWQRVQESILAERESVDAAETRIEARRRHHRLISQDAALGPSRGARGVKQRGLSLVARNSGLWRRPGSTVGQRPALRIDDWRRLGLRGRNLAQIGQSVAQSYGEVRLAVLEQVGQLRHPIIGVDRDDADAQPV